ncbi:hypothetical protein [Vibrio vulnificus]|uniref:hypothetical protein n=1 Tax=Vibrio vulnificus TaxID=672 RepID=UPI000735AEE4|nr:hypothetical protein [Vibrio vulnificus]PNM96848.1 hypothetical protein AL547_021765 [Vibrio vulnificus]SUP35828.1 Uncharacterised protein [Vibrio vulnificus]HAS8223739.1 hypothetical protein [Vibrio vulnificus]HAS8277946.1 hypothetical protein [Vibrio vulnificus]
MEVAIKIYVYFGAIAFISLCVTFAAPVNEIFRGVTTIPAVGALMAALYQLVRDHSVHERNKELNLQRENLTLASSSHMANAVFDKQAEFTDQYVKLVLKAFHELRKTSDCDEAHGYAAELTILRLEYMNWLTEEIDINLENFERQLRKLGSNSMYTKMPKSAETNQERRDNAAAELLDIQLAFTNVLEKSTQDHDASLIMLSKKMRAILGVEELAHHKNRILKHSGKNS